MKALLPVIAICAFLTPLGVANAQTTVITPTDDTVVVPAPSGPGTMIIQPEQQTIIREYVKKNPVASINILGLELSLGGKVPETVVLHELPDIPARYTVIDGRTVLVDPDTHEIIQILD